MRRTVDDRDGKFVRPEIHGVGTILRVDGAGSAYVTDWTDSDEASFPVTVGPVLTFKGGIRDAFVAKVKSDGTGFDYVGYIGGSDYDGGFGIAVDFLGNLYVATDGGVTHEWSLWAVDPNGEIRWCLGTAAPTMAKR